MNIPNGKWLLTLAIAGFCAFAGAAQAQNTQPDAPPPPSPPPAIEAPAAPAVEATDVEAPAAEPANKESDKQADKENDDWGGRWRARADRRHPHWHHGDDDVVSIGGNSKLAKGGHADSVVSVFGSSTVEGEVSDAVVSVLGDTRVEGPVGDTAVAVLGDNYVNSTVSGDVVAVLGNVELGPKAVVNGNVVAVGGKVIRDPAAVVHGGVKNVFGVTFGSFRWLRPWVEHCLLYGRPLALAAGIGWAWAIALGFLALYVLIAFMFKETVDRCVRTFETQPGQTFVAALLGMLLTPVLFALLCITVVGIAFVPIVALGMFLASAFGKVVVLAWFGRLCAKNLNKGEYVEAGVAVLIGGAVVLALYLVPVLGFIVYKVLGILGFGVAAYALILLVRERRNGSTPAPEFATASAGAAGTASAPDAGSTSGASNTSDTSNAASAMGAAGATRSADSSGASEASSASSSSSAPGAGMGSRPAENPAFSQAAAAEATGVHASALPRADFTVRMAALLIDVILVSVLLGILDHSRHAELLALAAYGAAMWKLKGTTIGGIVFGLKVVRIDGRPIDWPTAVVRALSCFLSLIVVGLGFITIAFDPGKQGWHDKIAGTAVVRVPKGVSLL